MEQLDESRVGLAAIGAPIVDSKGPLKAFAAENVTA
jgi:hypothetical protein